MLTRPKSFAQPWRPCASSSPTSSYTLSLPPCSPSRSLFICALLLIHAGPSAQNPFPLPPIHLFSLQISAHLCKGMSPCHRILEFLSQCISIYFCDHLINMYISLQSKVLGSLVPCHTVGIQKIFTEWNLKRKGEKELRFEEVTGFQYGGYKN